MKPELLPDRLRKLMSAEDRKAMGIKTSDEVTARQGLLLERQIHNQFIGWLRINNLNFVYARPDRKSTIQKGWPDFTVILGSDVLCVEFKLPKQSPTEEQSRVMAELRSRGTPVAVCYSLAEAITFVMAVRRL